VLIFNFSQAIRMLGLGQVLTPGLNCQALRMSYRLSRLMLLQTLGRFTVWTP
jgi:hypothetical protein